MKTNKNNLSVEQRSIQKRRNCIKAIAAASAVAAGIGGGVGIGYAICHSQKQNPPPIKPILSAYIPKDDLKIGTNGTATLSLTQINVDKWQEVMVNVRHTGLTIDSKFVGEGLTRTVTIGRGTATAGQKNITISGPGFTSIPQTITVYGIDATPTVVPTITDNHLKVGTEGTAILTVQETNVTSWVEPSVNVGSSGLKINDFTGHGFTRTCAIEIGSASAGTYNLTISVDGLSTQIIKITVLAVDATPSLQASISGHLQIDSETSAKISVTALNGATLPKGLPIGLTGFNFTEWSTNLTTATTTITLDKDNPVKPGDYYYQISNDNVESNEINIVVDNQPGPIAVKYAEWNEVKECFDVTDKAITGFAPKGDEKLEEFMVQSGYNGIDFGTSVTSIEGSGLRDSKPLQAEGHTKYLKFSCIEYIVASAFSNCDGLRGVDLGNSDRLSINQRAFNNCNNLKYFNVDSSAKFINIGDYVFSGCEKLTSREAFKVSNKNLNGLGTWVESLNGAWVRNATSTGALGSIAFGKIEIDTLSSIGNYAFEECKNITEIKSWDTNTSLTSIGTGAFSNCTNLAEIRIPNFVATIGDHAFIQCRNLFEIIIPSAIVSIDIGAFSFCEKLTTFDLSSTSITSISNSTFYDCINLSSVYLPTTITSIDERAFNNCMNLTYLEFRGDLNTTKLIVGRNAFIGCSNLKLIQLGERLGEASFDSNVFLGVQTNGVIKSTETGAHTTAEAWINALLRPGGAPNEKWDWIGNI